MAILMSGKFLLAVAIIGYAAFVDSDLLEDKKCHGTPGLAETGNVAFCTTDLVICVQEVWFYEHIPTVTCPDSEVTPPTPPSECCQTVQDQCYWKANASEVRVVHDECNSTRTQFGICTIPTRESRIPPPTSLCSNASSIRAIWYSCENGTCPEIVPDTTTTESTTTQTTPTTQSTQSTTVSSTEPGNGGVEKTTSAPASTQGQIGDPEDDDTGALVGGIIGGAIGLIIVIAIIVVVCRRKRPKDDNVDRLAGDKDQSVENGGFTNVAFTSGDKLNHHTPLSEDDKTEAPSAAPETNLANQDSRAEGETLSPKSQINQDLKPESQSPAIDDSNFQDLASERKRDTQDSSAPKVEQALSPTAKPDPETDHPELQQRTPKPETTVDHQSTTSDDTLEKPMPAEVNGTANGSMNKTAPVDDMYMYQVIHDYYETSRM